MNRLTVITTLMLILACGVIHADDRYRRTKQIDRAIAVLISRGIAEHKIRPRPNHRLLRSEDLRWELATAIEDATHEYPSVSPYLLIAIGFREGSFNNASVGGIGERSTFQMTPSVIRFVRRMDSRCKPTTYRGAAYCAAVLLDHYTQNECGTIEGAMLRYATGYACTPQPDRKKHQWIVRDRLGIARHLEKIGRELNE